MDSFWKNKTVIAYIALAHHTRFIIPIMSMLRDKGARIKYVVGQAERSQEITAISLGLDYCHIFDYVTAADHDDIQANYDRLRQSIGQTLATGFLLAAQPATVTDKVLFSAATEYVGIRNLLDKEGPTACIALHELNRWGKMFAFWAKKRNVPFFTLQEGLGYNLDFGLSGHAQYATLNLVWGRRIKDKLVGFEAPSSKIIPVGNTHLAGELAAHKAGRVRETKRKAYQVAGKQVVLLVLSAILPDPKPFDPIFRTVAQSSSHALFVKFHPACKPSQIDQWTNALAATDHAMFIHDQETIYTLLSMADVCVLGQRSTTGLEAVVFGKPLVKLDFAYTADAPYSFVDQGVAKKMSAAALADALMKKTDFADWIHPDKVRAFLDQELVDTQGAIDRVIGTVENALDANRQIIQPLPDTAGTDPEKKWAVFLCASPRADLLLAQLESVAVNSDNSGDYDVIILEPEELPRDTVRVLDSLEGDVQRILVPQDRSWPAVLNPVAAETRARTLIFIAQDLAPLAAWLDHLDRGMAQFSQDTMFCGRIADRRGTITPGPMVVDRNHSPVGAYEHLKIDFAPALKQRSFQMADAFLAMPRALFLNSGGLTPQAGQFVFPDVCLKAGEITGEPHPVAYLPDVQLIRLDRVRPKTAGDDSIYFYSRWGSRLWESQRALHDSDQLSPHDLEQARMAAAASSI